MYKKIYPEKVIGRKPYTQKYKSKLYFWITFSLITVFAYSCNFCQRIRNKHQMDAHNEFFQDKMCVGSHKHFLVTLRPNSDKTAKKYKLFL
jgi:hypothetical protein